MTTLLLIRHGETDWNIEGRYQGQADPPLNLKGLRQARRLAEEMSTVDVDVIYSSPLKRAFQTAEIVANSLSVPLHSDTRLMEIHQGDWQARLRKEIEILYPDLFRQWEMKPWEVTPPGGETLSQVQKRVYHAIDEIVPNHRNQCIGLVAHRIPIILLRIRYQDLDPNSIRSLELSNVYWEKIQIDKDSSL